MAFSLAKSTLFSNPTFYFPKNGIRTFGFRVPFSSFSTSSPFLAVDGVHGHKKRQSSVVVSALELGGVKISKDEIVRDDPSNNIPDTIFAKLGMQLHRRNQHPLGILKNAIYDYFDTNYPDKFDKFDDLCPIVSVRQVSSIMLRNHFLQCSCFCCCNYLLPVLELCSFLVPLSSFYFHIAGINSCFFPSSDRY